MSKKSITIRVSDEELSILKSASNSIDRSVSNFVKKYSLSSAYETLSFPLELTKNEREILAHFVSTLSVNLERKGDRFTADYGDLVFSIDIKDFCTVLRAYSKIVGRDLLDDSNNECIKIDDLDFMQG